LIPCIAFSQAQIDSSSLAADNAFELLKSADSIQLADSIQKVILQKQLEELKSTEIQKRKELEARLSAISKEDSLKRVRLKEEIDSLKAKSVGFPVVPYEDTLFEIHTKIGSISAKERAGIIQDRLREFYNSFIPGTDSIELFDFGQAVNLVWDGDVLLSVTELDAIWYERDKESIAQELIPIIYNDMTVFRESQSLLTWIKNIGLTLAVILLQITLVKLVNYVFRKKIEPFIVAKKGDWFNGIKIKDYEVLDPEKEIAFFLTISRFARIFVNLLQLYITIPLIFIIFPPTKWIAETLFGYVLSPVKSMVMSFINYIPDLITVIVIVVITRYILKFLRYLSEEIRIGRLKLQGFYPDWARPTFNIVRVLVYAFMFVVIFPYLPGSDSPVFQGVSVFLGLVFSLGSSSVISNMVAGLVLTYMRPFQIGDRIKMNEVVGDVVERTPFVTRVRTPKQEFITIPNSNILSGNVVNYSTSKKRDGIILHTTVTIGYDIPWRKVHQTLIDAALKTKNINPEPLPFVLQTSLDDYYVSYQLNAYSDDPNEQPQIYSDLHQNIQDMFNENGIEILSPRYIASRDGNESTIPKEYRGRKGNPDEKD
jgi:small-conductance mechanosensitive channel